MASAEGVQWLDTLKLDLSCGKLWDGEGEERSVAEERSEYGAGETCQSALIARSNIADLGVARGELYRCTHPVYRSAERQC